MKPKIFIVDKSKTIPFHLANIIGDAYDVKSNRHADRALLEIIRWKPDLLITGIEIGNISGTDLCTILKMIPELSGIPIIMLSSQEDEEMIQKAAAVGADYYQRKDRDAFGKLANLVAEIFSSEGESGAYKAKKVDKLLLVDDSVLVRTMLNNMFRSSGVNHVIQAQHGEEAIACLEEHHDVDLVLSDYHMPVMNGPELVKKIRGSKNSDSLPVIIATGEQKKEEIDSIMNAGANGVLLKPVSINKVKKVLDACVQGNILSFGCEGLGDG